MDYSEPSRPREKCDAHLGRSNKDQVERIMNQSGKSQADAKRSLEETFKKDKEEIKKPKYISLMICGYCGKKDEDHIEKVIEGKYANMLCFSCRCMFEDAIADVAKKYLTTNPKLIEYEADAPASVSSV